jgi:hypothetical protein
VRITVEVKISKKIQMSADVAAAAVACGDSVLPNLLQSAMT